MKTVTQNIVDLFGEMVEENKDEIKAKMKGSLLTIIGEVPSYISDFIASLSTDADDEGLED